MITRVVWVVLVAIGAASSTPAVASVESDAQEVARRDAEFQAAVKKNDAQAMGWRNFLGQASLPLPGAPPKPENSN